MPLGFSELLGRKEIPQNAVSLVNSCQNSFSFFGFSSNYFDMLLTINCNLREKEKFRNRPIVCWCIWIWTWPSGAQVRPVFLLGSYWRYWLYTNMERWGVNLTGCFWSAYKEHSWTCVPGHRDTPWVLVQILLSCCSGRKQGFFHCEGGCDGDRERWHKRGQ